MRLAKANDECKGKYPKKTKQNGGHNENGSRRFSFDVSNTIIITHWKSLAKQMAKKSF